MHNIVLSITSARHCRRPAPRPSLLPSEQQEHPVSHTDQPVADTPAPETDKLVWLSKVLSLPAKTIAKIQARQNNREEMSQKILGWTEDAANATKNGANLAHAVSAHGPGTDQMPRLVTGRRADEVAKEKKDNKTPPTNVTLKTVPGGTDVEMPAWDTVGDDPSNVSSRFGSATQMLLTVEEAFAQAALLQSRIAAEAKETDKAAMKVKEVKDAADALGKARTTEGKARLAAKTAKEALEKAVEDAKSAEQPAKAKAEEKVETLRKDLETKVATYAEANKAIDAAIEKLRAEKQKAVPGSTRSTIGDGREKLVLAPGGEIGESFKVGDDEKPLESGAPITPEDMKRRHASVTNTKGIKTATVIMDPAHVEDEFGQKHKAGFQIQTAFPSTGEAPQRDVTADDYKKIRAKEDGTAALDPARAEIAKAEQAKAKVAEDRKAAGEATAKLRKDVKDIEDEIAKLETRYGEDVADVLSKNPTYKSKEELVAAVEALEQKLPGVKASIRDALKQEEKLAKDEVDAQKLVAAKTGELAKQTKAMEQAVASKGAELDAKSYAAAETAATDAVASLATIREQKTKADKALAEADSKLPKDKLDKLKRDVSEAKSLEQSAIRQITEARQTLLKGLEDALAAATETQKSCDAAKTKAEQALTLATSAVVPAGPKPDRAQFTTGPEKQQNAEFQKALKAWPGLVQRQEKAEETKTAKAKLLEDAKAELKKTDDALADATAKAESLRNLMKVKL